MVVSSGGNEHESHSVDLQSSTVDTQNVSKVAQTVNGAEYLTNVHDIIVQTSSMHGN